MIPGADMYWPYLGLMAIPELNIVTGCYDGRRLRLWSPQIEGVSKKCGKVSPPTIGKLEVCYPKVGQKLWARKKQIFNTAVSIVVRPSLQNIPENA